MEIVPGAEQEERIAALEKRARELEALVKGLTSEMLDLKRVAAELSRPGRERTRVDQKPTPVVESTPSPEPVEQPEPPAPSAAEGEKIVIRPKSAARQEEQAVKKEEPVMVSIMQPDGTFKLEPRRGNRKMI